MKTKVCHLKAGRVNSFWHFITSSQMLICCFFIFPAGGTGWYNLYKFNLWWTNMNRWQWMSDKPTPWSAKTHKSALVYLSVWCDVSTRVNMPWSLIDKITWGDRLVSITPPCQSDHSPCPLPWDCLLSGLVPTAKPQRGILLRKLRQHRGSNICCWQALLKN